MEGRRWFGLLTVVGIAGAAAGMLVSYGAMPRIESQQRVQPFVAEVIKKYFGSDGRLAPLPGGIDYITIARKADGSQVRFSPIELPDGSFSLPSNIFDVSGKQITLAPETKSVTTLYIPAHHVPHFLARMESCLSGAEDPNAPRSTLLGYNVVEITTQVKNRFGTDRDDQWVAPALNCFALADTYTFGDGGWNESKVIRIVEGEPPEGWFAVPKGYTERSPSQVTAAYAKRFPGYKLMSDQMAAMEDRTYYLHRSASQ